MSVRIFSAFLLAASLGGLTLLLPTAAAAEPAVYSVSVYAGRSKTTAGETFEFTGEGTLTVDDVTGDFTYEVALSNGLTFIGSGMAAETVNGDLFAASSTESDGIEGVLIFTGKLKNNGKRITNGKLTVAIPNRLGPAPDGFVMTTAKLKGRLQ